MADKRITDVDYLDSLNSNESFFINHNNTIKQINRNNIVFELKNLGLTATATELNYVDGVTSNIQMQINDNNDKIDDNNDKIDSHVNNKDNPHNVTAAQVGAAPIEHTHGLNNQVLGQYYPGNAEWLELAGNTMGAVLKSVRTDGSDPRPTWAANLYSSGVVFGAGDTRGMIMSSYDEPYIQFSGGGTNSLNWNMGIVGNNDAIYDLSDMLTTSGVLKTSSTNYGTTLPTEVGNVGRIFFKKA